MKEEITLKDFSNEVEIKNRDGKVIFRMRIYDDGDLTILYQELIE